MGSKMDELKKQAEVHIAKLKALGFSIDFEITSDDIILTNGKDIIGDYIVPSFVTKIGKEAFSDNHKITKVFIPSSVKEIGDSAFAYCFNMSEVVRHLVIIIKLQRFLYQVV